MDTTKVTDITVQPYFDLEDFLNLCKETRIEGQHMQKLMGHWERWLDSLKARQLENGNQSWLAVWLPEDVEAEVDESWNQSPVLGYLANALAQYLCMAAIQDLIPQAANGGCAPSPQNSPALDACLAQAGLNRHPGTGAMDRRYAILTHYPFKGGCEVCSLQTSCGKIRGQEDFGTIVLPGHERNGN